MSGIQVTNLEIKCADLGQELANIKGMEEKVLNDALSVLGGQGPYAMFLYLKARHNEVYGSINEKALDFLKSVFQGRLDKVEDCLGATKALAENLDDFLFACDLLRIAFSYARYFLKAKGGGSS